MNLDFLASILCGLIAVVLFFLHSMTAKSHACWVTPPQYVRVGIAATGLAFMVRSVNALTLSHQAVDGRGHVNLEGLVPTMLILYSLVAGMFWLVKMRRDKQAMEDVKAAADIYEFTPQTARRPHS